MTGRWARGARPFPNPQRHVACLIGWQSRNFLHRRKLRSWYGHSSSCGYPGVAAFSLIPESDTTLGRLTCKELILHHLGEYLDGTLSSEIVEDFERHLARCPSCVAYVNTYKRTQDFTRRIGSAVMSEDMKARLREFLMEHLVKE